jgi:hypothetical protein
VQCFQIAGKFRPYPASPHGANCSVICFIKGA